MRLRLLSILIWLISFSTFSSAGEYDHPEGRVNDFAHILSIRTKNILEARLRDFDKKTSVEIIIVTLPKLDGRPIEDVTIEIAKKWKIGKKDKNNGVLFTIAPHDHKARLEVGYGLEPIITDATAKGILHNDVLPYFKKSDWDGGITAGIDKVMELVSKDKTLAGVIFTDTLEKDLSLSGWEVFWIALGVAILLLIMLAIFGVDGLAFIGIILNAILSGRKDKGYSGKGGGFGGGGSSD
jgi:uncharacterized protein